MNDVLIISFCASLHIVHLLIFFSYVHNGSFNIYNIKIWELDKTWEPTINYLHILICGMDHAPCFSWMWFSGCIFSYAYCSAWNIWQDHNTDFIVELPGISPGVKANGKMLRVQVYERIKRFILTKTDIAVITPHLWYPPEEVIHALQLLLDGGYNVAESPAYR